MKEHRERLDYSAIGASFTILLCCLYVLFRISSNLNKGMDWTDESWMYELSRSLAPQLNQLWGFQYIGHILLLVSFENILYLRVIRLLMYILSGYFLCKISIESIFKSNITKKETLCISTIVALLSTFFAFSYPPRHISYNELTAWVSSIVCVLILNFHLKNEKFSTIISLGIFNSTLIFLKFPAGIIITFITFIYLFLVSHRSGCKKLLLRSSLFISGFCIPPLLIQLTTSQAFGYYRSVYNLLVDRESQLSFGHPIHELLSLYIFQFMYNLQTLSFRVLIPVIILWIVSQISRACIKKEFTLGFNSPYLISLILLLWNFRLYEQSPWRSIGNFSIGLFLLNCIWLFILGAERYVTKESFLIILGLNSLPFITSLGTMNSIGGQSMLGNLGLQIATIAIARCIFANTKPHLMILMILGCMVILISPLTLQANTDSIYRTAKVSSLSAKTTGIPPLRDIYVTEEEAKMYSWLKLALQELAHDTKIIPLVDAGYNFAFTNDGFSSPWVHENWPASLSNLKESCQAPGSKFLKLAIISPPEISEGLNTMLNDALKPCGVVFHQDFLLEKRGPNDSVHVWVTRR